MGKMKEIYTMYIEGMPISEIAIQFKVNELVINNLIYNYYFDGEEE